MKRSWSEARLVQECEECFQAQTSQMQGNCCNLPILSTTWDIEGSIYMLVSHLGSICQCLTQSAEGRVEIRISIEISQE